MAVLSECMGLLWCFVSNNNINGNTSFWLTWVKIINARIIFSTLLDLIEHCNNIVVSSTMIPHTC